MQTYLNLIRERGYDTNKVIRVEGSRVLVFGGIVTELDRSLIAARRKKEG